MRFSGAAVPVASISVVALDPVQESVDPRAISNIVRQHQAVRLIPITFGPIPRRPQSEPKPQEGRLAQAKLL